MAKKVNMVKADRALSERVADFTTLHICKIADKVEHDKRIKSLEDSMQSHKNLKGSAVVTADQVDALLLEDYEKIEKENQRYAEARKLRDRFEWYQEDVDLYKAIETGNEADVYQSAVAWFHAWGLEDVDVKTNIVRDVVEGTKGLRINTARGIVNSGATVWTKARTKADVLKTVYAIVAQYMIKANTLKAPQVPDEVKAWFAPKKKQEEPYYYTKSVK